MPPQISMILGMVFVILLVFLIVYFVNQPPKNVISHWQHFYDSVEFTSADFYALIRRGVKKRSLSKLDIDTKEFFDKHILSGKRNYLTISYADYVFYVNASLFGNGTFISWWMCAKKEPLISKIPILNKLTGNDRNNKTFYQMDSEAILRSAIHSVIAEAAEEISTVGGERKPLSELQLQIRHGRKQ